MARAIVHFSNWFSSTLKGEMGYLGYFYMETKSFEIHSNVEGAVQLVKKSKVSISDHGLADRFVVSKCMGLFDQQ
jgi:hypothetical protein